MKTKPDAEFVCAIAAGGQAAVGLYRVRLDDREAERRAEDGWLVRGDRRDRSLLLVLKAPNVPLEVRGTRQAFHWRDAEGVWSRLEREYRVLDRLKGLPVPRGFGIVDDEALPPWERGFFEEYIDGVSVFEAVSRGFRPSPSEGIDFAHALLDLVGGPDGRSGLPSRNVAHRDIHPSQVILPRGGAGLAWGTPVLVDFGLAYSAQDALLRQGKEILTTQPLGQAPGWAPPERPGASLLPVAERFRVGAASDLWGWAMVVGYAVTGENLWGVRPDGQVELKTTPEFDQVMGGNAAFPPMLTKVGDSGLVQALVAALHPDPYQRDRVEISRALPPTPSVRLAQHEAENVRLGLVIKTTTAEAQAIARQAEIDAARSRLLETEVDRLGSTLEERAAEAAAARSELEAVRANAAAEAQRWDAALRAAQGASGAAGATPPVPGSRSRRVRRLLLGGLAAIACIVLAVSLLVWGGADSSQPASASGGTRTVVSDQGQRLRIARTGAPSPANDRSRSAARRTSGGWKGSSLQSRPLAGTDDAGHFAQTAGPAGRCSLEEGGDNYPLVVPVGEDLLTVVEHGDERDLVRRTSAGGRRWTRAVKRSACDGIFSAGGLGLVRGVQDAGDLTALDVSTGRTVWSVTLASAEEGDRVVRPVDADHGEVLLIGTHFVAKLELADGRARWMADVADGRSVCEAGLAGEVVWVTTCGGAVLQLDSKTGDQVGAVHHVGDHEAGLAVSPEGIAYVFGTARVDGVWVQAQSFGLDGRRRWERDVKLEGQYLAHAVAPGGALYLSRQYGTKAKVVELRRQSGNVRDVFGVDGGTAQPIAYDLATAMDGTVAIVDTWAFDDGRFTWKVCNLTRTTDPSAGWIYDPKGCTAEREGWRKISRGTDGALWAIGPDGERAGRL